MKPKLITAYIKEINGYDYIIDEHGKMILTHSKKDDLTFFEILNMFHNKYDILCLYDDEPDDVELWNDLVKLNRSLEPKESL